MLTDITVLDAVELGRRARALRLGHRRWYVPQAAWRYGMRSREYQRLEWGEMPDAVECHPALRETERVA